MHAHKTALILFSRDFQEVCQAKNATDEGGNKDDDIDEVLDVVLGLPSIYWPFIIWGTVKAVFGLGLIPLGFLSGSEK